MGISISVSSAENESGNGVIWRNEMAYQQYRKRRNIVINIEMGNNESGSISISVMAKHQRRRNHQPVISENEKAISRRKWQKHPGIENNRKWRRRKQRVMAPRAARAAKHGRLAAAICSGSSQRR
jgi:hypothetical protein